jgi:ribosomal protein S18 acetylase RimI-like enzyme
MDITFTENIPEKHAYYNLFKTTGWQTTAEAADLMLALHNSWLTLSVYDQEYLVGFGRVVSDGVMYAMVYDLIVRPEYQGKGIGKAILEKLINRCKMQGIQQVQLFCAKGKIHFYERFGFQIRPEDAPGMQLNFS